MSQKQKRRHDSHTASREVPKDVPQTPYSTVFTVTDNETDVPSTVDVAVSQPTKSSWKDLFSFTKWSHAGPLVAAMVAAAVAAALKAVLPVILGQVFNVIGDFGLGERSSSSTLSNISRWSVILVGVGVGNWMANSAFLALWITFGELQANSVRHDTFHSLLSKDMTWFDAQKEGISSLLVRIQTQTRELQLATSQIFGLLVCDVLTSLASLGIAFYYSWKLTLVLIATLPISAIVLKLVTRPLEPAIQAQRRDLATASKHATASISAIDLVKVFNGYDYELWQYFWATQRAAKHYLVQARCNSIQMGYVSFWVIFMFVVGFWYGVELVENGLSPGSVLTTFYATLASFQGIEALMPHWLVLAKGMSAGAFLKAVIFNKDGDRKVRKMERTMQPRTCHGQVELTNVSFAYPSNPTSKVLNKSSLSFPAGKVTFLVGRSGSGKSTIGNLVANFYQPLTGDVTIDGTSMKILDEHWLQENITLIQQTSVLFNDTFFKNIAFGHRDPENATRGEVLAACDAAMLQSTLGSLPQGLDTNVGSEGHNLSGGQKQRLALARARLRDPAVLILDEVTSGLDQVSRTLVMDAIRQWRRGKTTIIITHDVSQIEDNDLVYVLNNSWLVQEGFKQDLLKEKDGHFALLATPALGEHDPNCPMINVVSPGSPQKIFSPDTPVVHTRSSRMAEFFFGELESNALQVNNSRLLKRTSLGPGADYAQRLRLEQAWESPAVPSRMFSFRADDCSDWEEEKKRFSRFISQRFALPNEETRSAGFMLAPEHSYHRHSLTKGPLKSHATGASARTLVSTSAPSLITSQSQERLVDHKHSPSPPLLEKGFPLDELETSRSFHDPSYYLAGHPDPSDNTTKQQNEQLAEQSESTEEDPPYPLVKKARKKDSLFTTFKSLWPTIGARERVTLILGIIVCMIGAAATPAFSYCFAQLLGVMTSPGDKVPRGMKWAGIMLAVAVTDGLGWGGSRYLLERVGQSWVNTIRTEALRRILLQPKPWFEKTKNSPSRINECLDRNAEEMRNIVGKFIPIIVSVITMISISIIWALVVSWKLTLVSLAPLPVVAASIKGFAFVSGKWETNCNKGAEDASATLTEIFLNIRVVRALTLENYFTRKYQIHIADTLNIGLKRAGFTCWLYGLYQSMGYVLTSLVFYYGTVLLADKRELNVAQVMQVVNLLLFSIGTATGILSSIPQLTMAQATASQLLGYANMSTEPPKGQQGQMKLQNPLPIKMSELKFSYSRIPGDQVLRGVSLTIKPGKCTAIVGHSGCGKSTVVSLLLGLYVPHDSGKQNVSPLTFGGVPSSHIDLRHLRSMMAYVSQAPFLFPATIADNITYGLPEDSPFCQSNSICRAADAAGLHDWIVSLPEGYGTLVGDGGQALSGGQAQRLSIARALVRQPRLLVLDEPTSALDAGSAEMIRQTIRNLGQRGNGEMAIVLVTHSREMMRAADWIVMLGDGGVNIEEGTYRELWDRRGQFARLISGEVEEG